MVETFWLGGTLKCLVKIPIGQSWQFDWEKQFDWVKGLHVLDEVENKGRGSEDRHARPIGMCCLTLIKSGLIHI